MWRSPGALASLVGRFGRLGVSRVQTFDSGYASVAQARKHTTAKAEAPLEDQHNDQPLSCHPGQDAGGARKSQIGKNASRKERFNFLVSTLLDLKDNKEAVYGALDAWVAWEQNFPIAELKRAMLVLEKEQQWHRVVQVIKWMLSKGQGTTMGTYGQLIQALDMDKRAEEAHRFWMKKIGTDLHSVPWSLCHRMISVYYRNNMLENLVKLFKSLEAFDRQPQDKLIVQKVADAYEMLGLLNEKTKVLEKYNYLFTGEGNPRKTKRGSFKKKKKPGKRELSSTSNGLADAVDDSETSRIADKLLASKENMHRSTLFL